MHRLRSSLVIAATVLLLATACAEDESQDAPSGTPTASDLPTSLTAPARPTQGEPASQTESAPTVTGSPDATQTRELTTRLDEISPGLGDDEDRVLPAAAEVCRQSLRDEGDEALSSVAKSQFAVDGAVLSTFCHE